MQKEGKKQLLVIDPKNEIAFKGPYDHVVTEYFTLKNPTEWPIAFKVKTTAPKKYCVRPNNGVVAPHQTVQVAVMLQPGDLSQEKHRHKFMIQSVIVQNNNETNTNVDELFKSVSPEEIMDSKFRCVFLDQVSAAQEKTQHASHRNMLEEQSELAADDALSSNNNGGMEYSAADNHEGEMEHSQTTTFNGQVEEEAAAASNNGSWSTARTRKFTASLKSDTTLNADAGGHTQEKKDLETELKLAQEEIRMLKDKLQQVQRYASKFAPPVSSTATDADKNSSSTATGSGFLPNNQQLIQISAMVVFVSFIIGIFFGKTLF